MKEDPHIKVLLVEDNPGDARLIREMLDDAQYERYTMYHATTLGEGCSKLSEGKFNVVLLDIGLPDSTGIDSIEAIKNSSPEVPVIMLTGIDDEETAISYLKMGAQDYLVKGKIDTALLLRSVRYAIERNHAAALIESKQRFIQHIADTMPDILYIFDISRHHLVYANHALQDVLGYSSEEINQPGQSLDTLVHPDDLTKVYKHIKNLSGTGDDHILDLECRVKHHNGQWRWIHIRNVVFSKEKDGTTREILGTAHDITGRKGREAQIRASLEEKELLLREIHHRVKNNMTVIFSMLKLQSKQVKDKQYQRMFQDSMARIKSMALVHEKLYRSGDLAAINFSRYLKDLTNSMFTSYKIRSDRISLKTDVEDISLRIDSAIPCGLIISELVSNAIKHGFPDNRKGEINVTLHEMNECGPGNVGAEKPDSQNPGSVIELVVSDNGTGLPAEIDAASARSLGLTLVQALVKQLHGTIEVVRESGTEFRIRFKI